MLSSLREDYRFASETRPELVPIGDPVEKSLVAIDGGSSTLWTNGNVSIGVVRYGFVSYDPGFKIDKVQIESEFLLIRAGESSLDLERHVREVSMIEDASENGDIVLFDGALSMIPDVGLEDRVASVCDNTPVVGISKSSTLAMMNGRLPDIWIPLEAHTYFSLPDDKISEMVERRNLIKGANTAYAKLHGKGPTLRIDATCPMDDALRALRPYSSYRLCPGYPFPLAEIHRMVCMDDKRSIYDHKLRKEMEREGMGGLYLRGRIVGNSTISGFHGHLDGLV